MKSSAGLYVAQIDILRGFACFLVVVNHFCYPTWGEAISVDMFDAIMSTGWLGVPLFLFVSGFSLGFEKNYNEFYLKWFIINRTLRIYPLYIFALVILAYNYKIDGSKMIALFLLQTQDLPKQSPFGVLWSIQLEAVCYVLFPVFLYSLDYRKKLGSMLMFFLLLRVGMYFLPPSYNWDLSYSTLLGGGTYFLGGMLATRYKNKKPAHFLIGLASFLAICMYIHSLGGRGGGVDLVSKTFWIIMPEVLSVVFFFIVSGLMSINCDNFIAKTVAYFGMISYSAYVFHLFVLDFFNHLFSTLYQYDSGYNLIVTFCFYCFLLIFFASISFYAVEKPFLEFRKRYVFSPKKEFVN